MDFSKLEKIPVFSLAVQSIFKELGESLNKHATITNLVRHLPSHQRFLARDVVHVFIRQGILHKHRTDTFAWTPSGLEAVKIYLRERGFL